MNSRVPALGDVAVFELSLPWPLPLYLYSCE
ncbi:rCG57228, isoform CRA_d [Rattus norvegicus]|uniref:RCG57228, isoform CRA_d n=1 Tax=Rattus norvegicus TaxID=10116 RepID=A6KPH6_RAT|nr:rCG57228, isoform CRA_d [Rattus norvegicus]